MKMVVALVVAISALGCQSAPRPATSVVHAEAGPELPVIPADAIPRDGAVTEYWANGKVKSEREYEHGRLITATYYASNGNVVYEMSDSAPENQ